MDAYTPVFNITEFVQECSQNNVKYVFTYEYGGNVPYFNTTLTAMGVFADAVSIWPIPISFRQCNDRKPR